MKVTMNKKKVLILVILGIAWLAFVIWATKNTLRKPFKNIQLIKHKPETEKKVPMQRTRTIMVRAFKVKRVDYRNTLPVMGTVKGKAEIPLKFEINGTIKKIYFKEGSFVKKGEIVACLDDKDVKLKLQYAIGKLNSAKANYESLSKRLEIYEELYKTGALIKPKMEEIRLEVAAARSEYEAARAQKRLAEEELKKTCIVAPKDSMMGPRKSEEGEFITPHDQLGSLLDVSEVFVEVGIVERDIPKLKIGQKANIYVDAYPGKVFHGELERISPLVEGKSRTLTARIKVTDAGKQLLPGMFSRVEIITVDLHNAYIVPTTSLIKVGPERYLLPVVPLETLETLNDGTMTGMLYLREAHVGYVGTDYAEVKSGVHENDMVVTESQEELDNGIKVRITGTEEYTF